MKRMFLFFLAVISLTMNAGATDTFGFEDFLLVPVRVHLLSAKDKARVGTTLTAMDIQRILGKANGVWAQAGIQFYLESLVKEAAVNTELHDENREKSVFRWLLKLRPTDSQDTNMFNVYYVKEISVNGVFLGEAIFVKDTAMLTAVPGGINEPLPRVTSHEIGHGLSLEHRQNPTNLMASGTTGTSLNATEIEQARAMAATLPWIEPVPVVLKRAKALEAAGKQAEAKVWYDRLRKVPGVVEGK